MEPLSSRQAYQGWWPLAASWLLMGLELPLLSAVVARLAEAKVHLAAYGGVVFPLALLIESPVIMLLAASTALSRDRATYATLRRFVHAAGGLLTALHAALAFTPLYDLLIVPAFSPPASVVEPARLGLQLMLPWTWAIAYRRFHQGVLIRFGHPRAVTVGTLVRLLSLSAALAVGFLLKLPGIVVGAGAVALAVSAEAVYVGLRVRPVLCALPAAVPTASPLRPLAFARFYAPLVLTSLLQLAVQPLGTAAIARMPRALDSLAAWPVVSGFLFLLISLGLAYNEVVVAQLDRPGAPSVLRRFALTLAGGTTALLVLLAATPLARLWFVSISGLPHELARLAQTGLWPALLRPGLSALQSWYQGTIIHSGRTRGISEAVVIFLLVSAAALGAGTAWARWPGLYVAQAAFSLGALAQVIWLRRRSHSALAGA